MKPSRIMLAIALLTTLTPGSIMGQGTTNPQREESFNGQVTKQVSVDYLLFLPEGYAADESKRWPLILFLHGAGERGSDLGLVAKHGPPKIVKQQTDFPFVLVSPQCPTGKRWDNDTLLALLDDVVQSHRIDTDRLYLTGLSMGGYGTWSLGLSHPERFAALAPICGGGSPIVVYLPDESKVKDLKRLPIWAFHGAKDPVVPLAESEQMTGALKRFGNAATQLTVYPDAGHDSWTVTYDNPELYRWFLEHHR